MTPVREPKNHKFSFCGKHPSIKMNRIILFESGLEKDFIYLLDYDEKVTAFEEQPFRIYYQFEGKECFYTPDFMVDINGKKWLYECKPEKFKNKPENVRKFEAARAWCKKHDFTFSVVTHKDIHAGCKLTNVKILTKYARFECEDSLLTIILNHVNQVGEISIVELVTSLSDYPQSVVLSSVYYLLFHHRLATDINSNTLSQKSLVSIKK